MDNIKPILSICVLTYNRQHHLLRILEFLKDEYLSVNGNEEIEVIISDNNSTDGTDSLIKDFLERNKLNTWRFNRNIQNTGLLGNLLKGEELATGKYLWWWGDDDHYKKGIVRTVLNHLEHNPDYLLLNHSASKQTPWDGKAFKNALENLYPDNIRIEDIVKKNPGIIMFMSASIYKKDKLAELHSKGYKPNLSLPLLYSLYCAGKGNYFIEKKVWVDDNYKEMSWRDQKDEVTYNYIPYYISLMPEFGYEIKESEMIYANHIKLLKRRKRIDHIKRVLDKMHCLGFILRLKDLLK